MGLMNKEPTTEVGDGRIAMKVTEIPEPPPPKAPTYARDPISSSQNRLGGKEANGDSKGKDFNGETKGGDSTGENKGKDHNGVHKWKYPT